MRLPVLLVLACVISACGDSAPPNALEELGPFLDSLSVAESIPGFSFAVFSAGGTLYEHAGGVKRGGANEQVDAETTFEAASISKPVFAWVVHSLAQEGRLNLDAPLHTMAAEVPELAYDPRSVSLTPRRLLSHQGGLPNWRGRLNLEAEAYAELFAVDDTLRFIADPGMGYNYSGEGYLLLQRIVEERTASSLEELVSARIFDPLGMSRSSVVFDELSKGNYSHGHNREGEPDKWEIKVPLSSSTLHTTAGDLAKFGSRLAAEMLSEGSMAELAVPAIRIDSTEAGTLSWSAGLGVIDTDSTRYVFHGGNNVIFIADFVYGVRENLGYALLTNSVNGPAMVDAVEQRMFGRKIR